MARSPVVAAATVSVQSVWLLAAGAGARGVDVPGLLARHGLSDALGADVDARVPASAVLGLWAELPELCNLPHFGVWLAELACSAGQPLAAVRVTFTHPEPGPLDEYRRVLGVEPHFGATENALELPSSALNLPQRTADALLDRLVERHAHELSRELPRGLGPAARVRSLLHRGLSVGDVDAASLSATARELQLPSRTLQRRLATEGTSFAALLDEVRRELALQLLADPRTSVAEIAFALGFGDQPAFHRAFVRWTGKTPGEHRRRLASEANPN